MCHISKIQAFPITTASWAENHGIFDIFRYLCVLSGRKIFIFIWKMKIFLNRKFMNFHENNKSGIICGWLFQKPAVLAFDFGRKRVTFRNFLLKSEHTAKSDTFGKRKILGERKPTVMCASNKPSRLGSLLGTLGHSCSDNKSVILAPIVDGRVVL